MLQTVCLPPALAGGPSEVVLEGGTHNEMAPCFHFLQTTWRAYLARIGLTVSLEMKRPGFYPRGGGLITVHIQPWKIRKPITLTAGATHDQAQVLSTTAGLPDHVNNRPTSRHLTCT